ncbi:hypothetical protein A0H81_07306 [Grifola frondosa]|uniref:Uncharacterized protein n=1 Tax=Grifola frondosa TaxID=5627 RepID=A0A1C7M8E2_GRIFR|nr:hypothetical protein A0H81_07306 [Grifola frondosa]
MNTSSPSTAKSESTSSTSPPTSRKPTSCSVLIWIYRISNILPYCVWAVFSSLRAFAISGRNWQLASSVLLLLFVPIGVNIYFITLDRPLNLPAPIYCTDSSSVTVSTNFMYVFYQLISARDLYAIYRLVVISCSCSIVADALVLATTWFKTYEIIRAAAEARTRAYLGILLLRDGTVYFG